MGYALYTNTGAAIILICGEPIIAAVLFYKAKLEENLIVREQEEYEEADLLAGEILCNIRTVKQYEGEEKELARYAKLLPSPFRLKKTVFLLAFFACLYWAMPGIFIAIVFDEHGQAKVYHSDEEFCKEFEKLGSWELPVQPAVISLVLVCGHFKYKIGQMA